MEAYMALLQDPSVWIALFTLIVMEVVLGVDNLIFISILTNKLPEEKRAFARNLGIGLALIFRLALLSAAAFIVRMTEPVITLFDHTFSWKDIILILGGLFLTWKATKEIHHTVDPEPDHDSPFAGRVTAGTAAVIAQVLMLDVVFSIDSIITAVGMTPHIPVMVIAVLFAVTVMVLAAGPLSRFIERNPTIVTLALGFLLMIGMTLIAEGFHVEIPKGYIYASMAFSAFIEVLNMLRRRKRR